MKRLLAVAAVSAFALSVIWREPITTAAKTNQGSGKPAARKEAADYPRYGQTGASFKAILANVPKEVRLEFLASLMFKNGGLATAYIGGIKSHLSSAQYKQLFQFLAGKLEPGDYEGYACDGNATCVETKKAICISRNCTVGGPRGVTLGVMLARAPERDRVSFLESLDFRDGRLSSADMSRIRTSLSTQQFESLLEGLGASANDSRGRGGYPR
jgi:hypothetical protein